MACDLTHILAEGSGSSHRLTIRDQCVELEAGRNVALVLQILNQSELNFYCQMFSSSSSSLSSDSTLSNTIVFVGRQCFSQDLVAAQWSDLQRIQLTSVLARIWIFFPKKELLKKIRELFAKETTKLHDKARKQVRNLYITCTEYTKQNIVLL